MGKIKLNNWKIGEIIALSFVYLIIIINYFLFGDSLISCLSAFFGITYTFLAGKGYPVCYLYGVMGSGLYGWLSFSSSLWGNLILYVCYYIPMQITGYFKWKNNLKKDKNEIIKTKLSKKEFLILLPFTIVACAIFCFILHIMHDGNPVIDGVTTILSIIGMYLTVKRCAEQWIVWMVVNGLSAIMWIMITIHGTKVYSTVLMWVVYFILSVYFCKTWRKEISDAEL